VSRGQGGAGGERDEESGHDWWGLNEILAPRAGTE
jgi:hypothetical protein